MEGLEEIQEAIETTRQEETSEKDIDADKELQWQLLMADFKELASANNKDFKIAATDLIKNHLEWTKDLQQKHNDELHEIAITLQERFKIMDKAITDLWDYTNTVDDLRWAMLFHTVRLDHAFDKLVKMGFIEPWTEEMRKQMWSDDYVQLLGFDCSGEELRQQMIDKTKEHKKNQDGQKAMITGKK